MTDATLTLALRKVAIIRGRETLNAAVPEHEVRVLQAVHSPANVKAIPQPKDEMDEAQFDASAEAEIARLQRKYRRINTPDAVLLAYPQGAMDLERFGFKLEGGARRAAPAAAVRNRKAEAKAAEKKSAGKDKAETVTKKD